MTNTLLKLALFLVLGMGLVACSTDDNLLDNETIEFRSSEVDADCLDLVFPLSYTFPDGLEVSVESKEELKTLFREWKEENPDISGKPSLIFPVEATDAAGEVIVIETEETLKEILRACKGDRGGKSKCIELVYPVSYTLVDGTIITAESKQELKEALSAWKEANPDTNPEAELQFPIQVINGDDEVIDVATEEDLDILKSECKDSKPGHGNSQSDCFDIVYPVSFSLSDGTTLTVESRSELRTAIREWKEANPDIDPDPSIQFPIQVILTDETTVEVDSEEALLALKEDC